MASDEANYLGFEWVKSEGALVIAGLMASAGLIISLYNVIKHIIFYTLPEQQLHIIRIIFIVPLYCLVSWLSMAFSEQALYFETIRDMYEAFVIYCFLILVLGYVGGEANCVALISLKPPLKHPCPLCCLPTIQLNVKFLRFCKQSCIQFIIVKPIMAILNIVMLATGNYYAVPYQIFSKSIYNIAYTLALYGLLLFYLACKSDIRAYSPVRKFFAVKIIIFATYWQGCVVSFAPGLDPHTSELWNDFILCIEMTVFAIIHLYSFPWWEFRTGMPSSRELVAQNAKKVLSFKDVVRDVYHNVAPAYQTYVLQSHDGSVKQYKTKTYMIGNLNDPKVHNKFIPNFKGLRKKYSTKKNKLKNKDAVFTKGKDKLFVVHTDDSREYDMDDSRTETEIDYDEQVVNNINVNRENKENEKNEKNKKNKNKKKTNDEEQDDVFDDFGELNDLDDINGDINDEHYHDAKSKSTATCTPDSKTGLINQDSIHSNGAIDSKYKKFILSNNSEDGDDESDDNDDNDAPVFNDII